MRLRPYHPDDCAEIVRLFHETIHSVNLRDYTPEQADAWSPKIPDPVRWDRMLSGRSSFVAVQDGLVVGFGDIDDAGYLDHLFVHRDYQGRGIATALCGRLEALFPGKSVTVHASLTARGFFEKRGYRVIREQQVERRGVLLSNFVMERPASPL